jgi:hypothetical protein
MLEFFALQLSTETGYPIAEVSWPAAYFTNAAHHPKVPVD